VTTDLPPIEPVGDYQEFKPEPRVVFLPPSDVVTGRTGAGGPDLTKLPKEVQGYLRAEDFVPINQVRRPKVGMITAGQKYEYRGSLLINEKNQISRPQYDPNKETYGIMRMMDPATRSALLDTLYKKDFYDSGKPSPSGLTGTDQRAVANFLEFSNYSGVTWNVAQLQLSALPDAQIAGTRARVTAREDIEAVLRDEAMRLLGRSLTPNEARQAVRMIQQQEISRGSGGEREPALSVAAEQQVVAAAPSEAGTYSVANGIDILRDMLSRAGR
jgi:hypothetical protein